MILAIRSDSETAELALFDDNHQVKDEKTWQPGRRLSAELLPEILKLLKKHKAALEDIGGLVVYQGPGSFTSLRVGISVANALAYSLKVPIVGSSGRNWTDKGLKLLKHAEVGRLVMPKYGAEPNITKPRK